MKLPKKIYFAAAALLFIGGGITATILLKNDPQPVTFKQSASVQSSTPDKTTQNVTDVTVPETQTPPATIPATQQTTAEPVDPVQVLKDEVDQKVIADATARNIQNPDYQAVCMDQAISANGGYQNDSKAREALNTYLNPSVQDGVNYRMHFEAGCKVIYAIN